MGAVIVALLALAQLLGGCATPAEQSPEVVGEAQLGRSGAERHTRLSTTGATTADAERPPPLTSFALESGHRLAAFADDLDAPSRGVIAVWAPGDDPDATEPRWTSPVYDLWWAAPATLEAGVEFVVLGIWETRERHESEPGRHRTVRVVRWDGHTLVEVWRGSALARPMRDFEVVDLDGDGIDELRVEEAPGAPDGALHGIHRWTGFGFSRDP